MPLIWHNVPHGKFYRLFKNKDNPLQMEGFSMMLLDLKAYVGIDGGKFKLNLNSYIICIMYFSGTVIMFFRIYK